MKFVVVLLLAVFVHEVVPFVSNRENVDPLGPFVDPMVEPPAPEENQQKGPFDEASPDWMSWAGAYEGDMLLDEEQLRQLNDSSSERNAILNTKMLWTNGVIPYVFDSTTFSSTDKATIKKAFATYAEKSCLRMVERTTEQSYISIIRGGGCYSYVGGNRGYKQVVSLGYGCVYERIVIHEFMHAAGFFHEQSRYDRDTYVRINLENIQTGKESNFNKYSNSQIQHLGEPYDYTSVMHYSATAFSKNGKNTIDRLDGNSAALGNRVGFSQVDLNKLNKLYKCDDTTVTTTAPVTTSAPVTTMSCEDKEKYEDRCPYWANAGYCTGQYERFMTWGCKKSCDLC